MAKQTLNGIKDGLIGGFKKINQMFTELYSSVEIVGNDDNIITIQDNKPEDSGINIYSLMD